MSKHNFIASVAAIILFIGIVAFIAKENEPWTNLQLISPKELAIKLNGTSKLKPLIISLGPAGLIKGSVDIGPMSEKGNVDKLNLFLSKEKKGREIVVYCGCCPFTDCPNIRPAFTLLNSLKFTNHKLLNLPHNLKVDWIDEGYPMNE